MNKEFKIMENDNVVLSLEDSNCLLRNGQLISRFMYVLKQGKTWDSLIEDLKNKGVGIIPNCSPSIFNDGANCHILKPGKNWQKGKVKIKVTLEFCPDEPEITDVRKPNIYLFIILGINSKAIFKNGDSYELINSKTQSRSRFLLNFQFFLQ